MHIANKKKSIFKSFPLILILLTRYMNMYCIVDVETTGNGIQGNKITEIALFKHNGHEVVEKFTSLVNPECKIPFYITALTGIDNTLMRHAPTLREIAPEILEITKGNIFVAHSVNFDYNVIKNELKTIGLDFHRKKLCTVRLSRKLFPGLHSYSLGKLCTALRIPLNNRHRAKGDAEATVLLFEKLLRADGAAVIFKTFLNVRSQESTLPPTLPKAVFDVLPSKPGIYFFRNGKGAIIYIGKALDIKKRVLGHFYDKSTKELEMCRETATIDFELSGNELVALLMETAAIKQHFPTYNRSQKMNIPQYGIFQYEDRNGIFHLAFNKLKMVPLPLATFYSQADCRLYLEDLCATYGLCPKYCHLQENITTCSHYKIIICGGICRGTETKILYNEKVKTAIQHLSQNNEVLFIKEKGRNAHEDAFVLMKNGSYLGYGFIGKEMPIATFEYLSPFVLPQKDTLETKKILLSYMGKNPKNITSLLVS